jgi:uncharacterized OB-fold protein
MNVDWSNGIPLMAGPYLMGLTEVSPETEGYWNGVREGKLLIKRCTQCGTFHHPRRLFCACNCDVFDWVETAGTGEVYTFSTCYRAPTVEFEKDLPYTVGILKLTEGVFFFSRILPRAGEEVRIGAPVALTFRETGPYGMLPTYQITG